MAKEEWRVVEHSWSDTGVYAGDRRIALLSIGDEATEETQARLETEMAANARLFSAAPELLEACESVLSLYDEARRTGAGVKWKGEMVDRMRAAVAKAKGGTP